MCARTIRSAQAYLHLIYAYVCRNLNKKKLQQFAQVSFIKTRLVETYICLILNFQFVAKLRQNSSSKTFVHNICSQLLLKLFVKTRVKNSCSQLLFTTSVQLMFTAQILFTNLVHNSYSQLNSCSHLLLTTHVYNSCSKLLLTTHRHN